MKDLITWIEPVVCDAIATSGFGDPTVKVDRQDLLKVGSYWVCLRPMVLTSQQLTMIYIFCCVVVPFGTVKSFSVNRDR